MLEEVENFLDVVKYRLRLRLGIQQLRVVAYRGYRSQTHAFIRGRVLMGRDTEPADEDHGKIRNFGNMAKRFLSAEIPRAVLEVKWEDQVREVECDHEGFYHVRLPLQNQSEHPSITVEVLDPVVGHEVKTDAPIFPFPGHSDYLVVSDIDDTVLLTWATKIWKMVILTLFGNAATRTPFDGVSDWYQLLKRGCTPGDNLLFYVSSSPWNLYDFIEEFLSRNDIPVGSMFLKDHGLKDGQLSFKDHQGHKEQAIRALLDAFPDLPILLIGDSGQKDPEIYRDLVAEFPQRFRGVLIRNVSVLLPVRVNEVERIGQDMEDYGVSFSLFESTAEGLATTREWDLISET